MQCGNMGCYNPFPPIYGLEALHLLVVVMTQRMRDCLLETTFIYTSIITPNRCMRCVYVCGKPLPVTHAPKWVGPIIDIALFSVLDIVNMYLQYNNIQVKFNFKAYIRPTKYFCILFILHCLSLQHLICEHKVVEWDQAAKGFGSWTTIYRYIQGIRDYKGFTASRSL